jgi:hypothetical protein
MAHVCIGPSRPCVLTVLEYISWFAWFHHLCWHAPITFGPFMDRSVCEAMCHQSTALLQRPDSSRAVPVRGT